MNKVLVHTRTEAEGKLLADCPNVAKMGESRKFVHGLTASTQAAILVAKAQGKKIITNGLPVDIASQLGEITQIPAWDRIKDDGSRSTGTGTPVDYAIHKIKDVDAYNQLKQNPLFADAFESTEEEE